MKLRHFINTAVKGLRANKSRSVLTILGIVIGITAIILLMSLGQGAQNLILSQLQGMGSKTIVVLPGRQPKGPSDVAQILGDSLKQKDFEALQKKANVPTAKQIMPIVFGASSGMYKGETYKLTIFGATPLIGKMFDLYPSEGAFFANEEVTGRADVAVIGSTVKKELFGNSEALNQRIKMNGKNFRVIGILPQKGQVSFFNFDEVVLVPYTTAQQYILGIKYFHRLIIEADTEGNIRQTVRDIETTIRNSHGITDSEKDDFHVETQADLAARLGVVMTSFTLFLVAVAAVSLVVGGIGIMNIMLVSVTERTREIGLRKAIGATNSDILIQFLLEAILLTAIGGIIGIGLGSGFSFAASLVLTKFAGLNWEFSFPFFAAGIGLLVATVIGLAFGIYPARQAAKKSPIEALRYE
ncbi:ABC transporter permease [Candidatus Peregrinibacteria bacterium]|nr:ABC transporter permease [Candidatus Peregrinibacteria bacterium]